MGDNGFQILKDDINTPGAVVCKDGVHFGFYASGAGRPALLLYKKGTEEVAAELPFPEPSVPGNFYSMKVKLSAEDYEYNFRDGDTVVTDPYAGRIAGREAYGQVPSLSPHGLRGAFVTGTYRWDEDQLPSIPFSDVIMYHLHVRGFTMHRNSGVSRSQKGTFAGLKKKIPYLLSLGINQVKLMPVYEFSELEIPEYLYTHTIADKEQKKVNASADGADNHSDQASATMQDAAEHAFDLPAASYEQTLKTQEFRKNYWGYGPGYYFAPKSSYAASKRADVEFKDMVRAFHKNGIEVILEFSFSAETDIGQIIACLNYWACEYHVDGFSIVGREELSAVLARLPLFTSRKLICSCYPDDFISEKGSKQKRHIARSNDGFMNDSRRLLKGDAGTLETFGWRTRYNPAGCAQINYMTNHDGFTLMDLVSYNMKYNDENGEMGRDGSDANYSWNCGEEGPSAKRKITALRMRQRKNAYAMMLLSQGTPMLLAGDEFGNTQKGNNNPWCQDGELTWLDFSRTKGNKELTAFVSQLIAYRKAHRILHLDAEPQCADYLSSGFPDLSYHGARAWYGDMKSSSLHMGCMYSGHYAGEEDFLYIAWNFHWEEQQFALPLLPDGYSWIRVMDTGLPESFPAMEEQENLGALRMFSVSPRTVVLLEGRTQERNAASGKLSK
ncbi:MAG: Type II secretory pathway, pullulanase PulA and related glycosidase [Clostridiales bacterium]|nr:Type II secretory pathway, pullulanase PulA and related glycosidase [Clostridiales bacterium]